MSMKKVLIVDDSQTILSLIKSEIAQHTNIDPYYAETYKEANKLIRQHQGKFHAALLDLALPDAPNGEIVKLANASKIPAVILSATMNQELKDSVINKDVVDFVLKDNPASIKFAINAIQRTLHNYDTTILVVDDSPLYRQTLRESLTRIHLNVIEAENGEDALEKIKNNPHISLVITDYEMPKMNGITLTYNLRMHFQKDDLAVIAMSSLTKEDVVNSFLRVGANDFINKPFTHSEVVTRINANLDLIDLFKTLKDVANKDFLTGMFNRRYFFDSGVPIFKKNKRKVYPIAIAMIDIDKFKNINDTYGHDVGDDAIKEIKTILDDNLRDSDLVSRFGGEEFCILLEEINLINLKKLFEKVRLAFETNVIETNGIKISYTISTGICYGLMDTLDDMIKMSDEALYEAKTTGRNKVVIKEIL